MYQNSGASRSRVDRVLKSTGYKAGGHESDSDRKADIAMIKRAIGEHDEQLHPGHHTRVTLKRGGFADGGMAANRMDQRSRGGKKHPTSQTNIVISPPAHPPMGPPMGGPPIGLPPRPPMAAPAAMPPRPPMAPPPGGMPGGMPMGGAPGMPPGLPPGMPPGGMPPRPMIKTGGAARNGKGGEGADFKGGAGGGRGRIEKAERDPEKRTNPEERY
jgi:hypothetical protein